MKMASVDFATQENVQEGAAPVTPWLNSGIDEDPSVNDEAEPEPEAAEPEGAEPDPASKAVEMPLASLFAVEGDKHPDGLLDSGGSDFGQFLHCVIVRISGHVTDGFRNGLTGEGTIGGEEKCLDNR